MERKIGEIFEYNGEWYQAIDNTHGVMCSGCTFVNEYNDCEADISVVGNCGCEEDNPLIFKKLEKVGEPMKIHGRLVIKVKADAYKCMRCCFYSKGKCELTIQECEHYDCGEESNFLDIKQNKEDMKEGKLDPHMEKVIDEATQKMGEEIGRQIEANINKQRMKPFNLEAAKAGKPVCTRGGRKARIICFDKKGERPIIALVQNNNREDVYYYYNNGVNFINNTLSDNDLMMLPEKKEGWAKIRKDINLYDTKEEADRKMIGNDEYVTAKVCWEE